MNIGILDLIHCFSFRFTVANVPTLTLAGTWLKHWVTLYLKLDLAWYLSPCLIIPLVVSLVRYGYWQDIAWCNGLGNPDLMVLCACRTVWKNTSCRTDSQPTLSNSFLLLHLQQPTPQTPLAAIGCWTCSAFIRYCCTRLSSISVCSLFCLLLP